MIAYYKNSSSGIEVIIHFMIRKYWFHDLPAVEGMAKGSIRGASLDELTNTPQVPRMLWSPLNNPLKLQRVGCCLVEKGHFVEYNYLPYGRGIVTVLFFGPGELLIPCSPEFSFFQALDETAVTEFRYQDIFRTLRNFPEAADVYRKAKQRYEEKVKRRIAMAWTQSDQERLRMVRETEGWILELAPKGMVADYLGVTAHRLQEMRHHFIS
jgi:hypothetical protein